jgi:hypothetical protein
VFAVRYEHTLHMEKYTYTRNKLRRPVCVSPVRYELHLHIKKQSCPRNGLRKPIGVGDVQDLTLSKQLNHRWQ